MKKNMKKSQGFTLAELLIVVAIIAVLVAISIPVFTTQLAKAELATQTSNARAAYAEAVTKALGDGTTDTNGSLVVPEGFGYTVPDTTYTINSANGSIVVGHKGLSNSFTYDDNIVFSTIS